MPACRSWCRQKFPGPRSYRKRIPPIANRSPTSWRWRWIRLPDGCRERKIGAGCASILKNRAACGLNSCEVWTMKVTLLSLAAAVLPQLTPDPGERTARLLHERGIVRGEAPHCFFKFCHCAAPLCRLGRERQPGDDSVTEHYTRNTESVLKWCNKCARLTVHKVSDGRAGRCSEHHAEDTQAQQKAR